MLITGEVRVLLVKTSLIEDALVVTEVLIISKWLRRSTTRVGLRKPTRPRTLVKFHNPTHGHRYTSVSQRYDISHGKLYYIINVIIIVCYRTTKMWSCRTSLCSCCELNSFLASVFGTKIRAQRNRTHRLTQTSSISEADSGDLSECYEVGWCIALCPRRTSVTQYPSLYGIASQFRSQLRFPNGY